MFASKTRDALLRACSRAAARVPRGFHSGSSLLQSGTSAASRATGARAVQQQPSRALLQAAVTGSSRRAGAAALAWGSATLLFGASAVAFAAESQSSPTSGKPRKAPGPGDVRNIVIAVDASKTAEEAFEWALNNVIRDGDMVTIVHVRYSELDLVSPGEATGGFLPLTEPRSPAFFLQRSREITKKFATELDQKNIAYQTLLLEGDPREKLCEALAVHDAHLLVLGSRGLSAFDRILLGSTSQHCATHSPCPVLIYRSATPSA